MTALLRPDETLTLGVNVIIRPGDPHPLSGHDAIGHPGPFVAPPEWVALTGPCPTCVRSPGWVMDDEKNARLNDGNFYKKPCPGCRDGHRIVPLYRICPKCNGDECFRAPELAPRCDCDHGRVLVGRGSIEVVPVVTADGVHELPMPCVEVFRVIGDDPAHDNAIVILWWQEPGQEMLGNRTLPLDPLPVPGRDWGIVVDVKELTE